MEKKTLKIQKNADNTNIITNTKLILLCKWKKMNNCMEIFII